jgi:hypothetical protein
MMNGGAARSPSSGSRSRRTADVRREELVAAAREVGWEPFSCEEIRAVTLEI